MLVTGATGFLGGWLIKELSERGARVVALVRKDRPQSQFHLQCQQDRVAIVRGTVWDQRLLETAIEQHEVEVIFHTTMAGGDVTATLGEPVDCFRSTAESTLWLLDALRRKFPATTLIVSSSDKAYGQQELPYRETQALAPRHPQEVAKATQDLLAQSFGKVYGVRVAVTRCANYYGPYDFNFTRIIPHVARCAANGETPLLRSNGQFKRDFIYVQEAAWAHLELAERVARDATVRGEAFNYSYGVDCSVNELVREIQRIAGVKLATEIQVTAQHEIPDMQLSSEKARTLLGWKPRMTFAGSLKSTVGWYLEHFRQAQLCLLPLTEMWAAALSVT